MDQMSDLSVKNCIFTKIIYSSFQFIFDQPHLTHHLAQNWSEGGRKNATAQGSVVLKALRTDIADNKKKIKIQVLVKFYIYLAKF